MDKSDQFSWAALVGLILGLLVGMGLGSVAFVGNGCMRFTQDIQNQVIECRPCAKKREWESCIGDNWTPVFITEHCTEAVKK